MSKIDKTEKNRVPTYSNLSNLEDLVEVVPFASSCVPLKVIQLAPRSPSNSQGRMQLERLAPS